MTVVFEEKFQSRSGERGPNPWTELVYVARGSDDDIEIYAEAVAQLPASYDDMPRQSIRPEQESNGLWFVTLRYAYSRGSFRLPTGGSAFSFDTTGGTRRITQSLETIASYAPLGSTPPNFNGAINVSDQGVEGVDIPERQFAFREIRIMDLDDVDAGFLAAVYECTGCTNDATFMGYARGELLFEGAVGQQRGEDDVEIVFSFRASPNADDIQVGNIQDIAKKGWEYLWTRYREESDTAAGYLVHRPIAAYVERVFEEADFTQLGL